MTSKPNCPNLLMVMADQLTSFAVGCYGNRVVKTPAMDTLADRGVVFENAYCNVPLCVPSRASMCSGRLGTTLQNFDNGTGFPAHIPTFMHHLRHGGYEVVLSGKMHFVGPDQLHGFEQRLTTDIYPSSFKWTRNWAAPVKPEIDMISDLKKAGPYPWTIQLTYDEEVHLKALEQLRYWGNQNRQGNRDRPWFLCASYTHPHDPPFITAEWWNLYENTEIDKPTPPPDKDAPIPEVDKWLREYLALEIVELSEEDKLASRRAYYAMTSYFDSKVDELVETLERQDLLDNTIVIVTSDHGDMVGEHDLWFKRSYYEWATRVPFIVSWPSHYPEGRRVTQVFSLVDFFPTLLDMVGLPAAEGIDGHSAARLITEDDPDWKDEAIIDFTSSGAIHPWRAVVQGRYKYLAVHTDKPRLFDLENDPGEWHNLVGKPEYAKIEKRLRKRATKGWNPEAIEAAELRAQRERRFIREAMMKGQPTSWDFQPFSDASKMFTR